ncbi:MAG: protoporphyrinogen oxidase [Deltaproteobacteria bacterium CG11_big_fil_rev_8_21_14_0_20_47_16]|nr:MAG: protoporphyrinogen oxidase [Deltaproteobacteria bacterium CG11_big_fil_rev_8_21_14_0_20_47_16]
MSISPAGNKDVVIIGAGIAGLTAAYTLKKAGYRVLVLERSDHSGGLIQTANYQDFLCELGPNTFLPTAKPLRNLITKLGIDSELIQSPSEHNRRYIFKKGKLQELHMSPFAFLKSGLVSLAGKLRLLWEPFAKGPPSEQDESVADFVTRRLGSEILDSIVDPMVTGIIAGNPHELSAAAAFPKLVNMERHYKSIFGAMRARKKNSKTSPHGLLGFKNGMGTLCHALNKQLDPDIWHNVQIEKITQRQDRQWELRLTHKDGHFIQTTPTLLIATPAYVTATLLSSISPDCVTPLSAIPYAPITVVHLGYSKKEINNLPNGFGFLVPRSERIRLLGTIWSSQIFSNRAPDGYTLLTAMYGGASDPDIMEMSDNDLVKQIQSDLEQTLSISTRPSFINIRRIIRGIPQYTIGHLNRIDHLDTLLKMRPGLFLTGNYLTGYSVSETVLNATQAATETAEYLMAHGLA